MKLSPRLECVARHVDQGIVVADIGTDHAYIPIYLIEKNISSLIYACDIGVGPLEMAKKQINNAGLSDKIIPLLGEGLDPVKSFKIGNIIIAGMGGILIRNIIKQNIEMAYSVDKLILQPMIAQDEVRRYLLHHGFKIVEEDLAKEDRRIYQIIVAQKGVMQFDKEIYYDIGYDLVRKKHPLLKELIASHRNRLDKIIHECKKETTYNAFYKIKDCEKKLNELREVENVI
ncbi:MAG: tRNA (adenine(22)-N(1))-methyltransferase [Eubacteriales bacterium]